MEGAGNYPKKNTNLQYIDGRSQMRSGLPRFFLLMLMIGGKCSRLQRCRKLPQRGLRSTAIEVIDASAGDEKPLKTVGDLGSVSRNAFEHSPPMFRAEGSNEGPFYGRATG